MCQVTDTCAYVTLIEVNKEICGEQVAYKTDTCDVLKDWNLIQIHMSWQKNVSSEEFNHYALVSEH